jgi:hypothetical protein
VTTRLIIFNTHITNNCNRNNKGVDSGKQTEEGGVTDSEDVAILRSEQETPIAVSEVTRQENVWLIDEAQAQKSMRVEEKKIVAAAGITRQEQEAAAAAAAAVEILGIQQKKEALEIISILEKAAATEVIRLEKGKTTEEIMRQEEEVQAAQILKSEREAQTAAAEDTKLESVMLENVPQAHEVIRPEKERAAADAAAAKITRQEAEARVAIGNAEENGNRVCTYLYEQWHAIKVDI